ncbi:hypothetical protein NKH18_32055 [Streptomyces sp. M10(2022)]
MLFPDGAPRLLETVRTPLGRSGFVCVPLFADELGQDAGLVAHTARAVSLASSLGARCVSLAGMIPSLTAYGFDVVRFADGPASVTTGHATTVVSVVRTVHAALEATGQDLADLDVAFVGLGSIGSSSLELLLTGRPASTAAVAVRRSRQRAPAAAVGATAAGAWPGRRGGGGGVPARTARRGVRGRAAGDSGEWLQRGAGRGPAEAGHRGGRRLLPALLRHRPGTGPDAGAPGRARAGRRAPAPRRYEPGDRRGLPAPAAAGYQAQPWIEGTLASCRTESLLHAADPGLPLVHGLVDEAAALAYWGPWNAPG